MLCHLNIVVVQDVDVAEHGVDIPTLDSLASSSELFDRVQEVSPRSTGRHVLSKDWRRRVGGMRVVRVADRWERDGQSISRYDDRSSAEEDQSSPAKKVKNKKQGTQGRVHLVVTASKRRTDLQLVVDVKGG